MTFGVDPDTHIDSLEQAEHATVEGTSKWSCKLTITGTHTQIKCFIIFVIFFFFLPNILFCLFIFTSNYHLKIIVNKVAQNANFLTDPINLS